MEDKKNIFKILVLTCLIIIIIQIGIYLAQNRHTFIQRGDVGIMRVDKISGNVDKLTSKGWKTIGND